MKTLNNGWIAFSDLMPGEEHRDSEGEVLVWTVDGFAVHRDIHDINQSVHLYWQPVPVGPARNMAWVSVDKERMPLECESDSERCVLVWHEQSTTAGCVEFDSPHLQAGCYWMPYPAGPEEPARFVLSDEDLANIQVELELFKENVEGVRSVPLTDYEVTAFYRSAYRLIQKYARGQ